MAWWLWMLAGFCLVAVIFNERIRHIAISAMLGQITGNPRKRRR